MTDRPSLEGRRSISEALDAPRRSLPDGLDSAALGTLGRGSEALQSLRQALERVERESASLMRVATGLEDFVRQQEARFAELEQELNDTALLYVASYQLQLRVGPKQVLSHVRELLEQLVGVQSFALYLAGPGGSARAVASRGLREDELGPLRTSDEPMRTALSSRSPVVREESPLPPASVTAPLATIPLLMGEHAIGALLVVALFGHKTEWAPVDVQLFQLLAAHGGSALMAAHLYERLGDFSGALASLGESLR